MRFALDEEQEALRETTRDVLADPSTTWEHLAKLGLTGLLLPEDAGGGGAGPVEAAAVLREAGRALTGFPLLAVTVAGSVLAATPAGRPWLPGLADGSLLATVALDGPPVALRADGEGWTATGELAVVLHGAQAGLLVVTGTHDGEPVLIAVEVPGPGVAVEALPALDPTRPVAAVRLDAATATPLLRGDDPVARAGHLAAVLLAAEQVGGAEQCLEEAVAYARTRVQFGRPIGSFQALKHLLADALLDVECARAAADYAAWAAAASPAELPVMAGVAQAVCSDAYVAVAGLHLQVHGGMGFTWEHTSHLHVKRSMTSRQLFGGPDGHREQLAVLGLSGG